MALYLLQSPPLLLRLPRSSSVLSPRFQALLLNPNRFPPRTPQPWTLSFHRRRLRAAAALPAADQDLLLEALAGSPDGADGEDRAVLPAIRSYEGDLARLTVVGDVSSNQALTAAAADGGNAAQEHLSSGAGTMVVETVFPGSPDEHSTISTRLFLPAEKVKEKATEIKISLITNFLSSNPTASKNILALTFRQVVLQRLWSFRFAMFSPGTERNMDDLMSNREAPTDFIVSSSDERFLSALAEAVCSRALEATQVNYLGNVGGFPSKNIFGWFQKPLRSWLVDSSICVYKIPEGQIVKNAMKQVEKFNLVRGESSNRERKSKNCWWEPPIYSTLEKAGGPRFSAWANEFIPAYSLQIDADKFKDTYLEGWQELGNNRWEVLLTHFQMVELSNILDMYFEDRYTLPGKQLSCGFIMGLPNLSKNKNSSWKMLFITLACGCIVVFAGVLARVCQPHFPKIRKASDLNTWVSSSETNCSHFQSLETVELEALCISVVKKIKDALGWPGDIMFDANVGAWTGSLPSYLRNMDLLPHSTSGEIEHATNCSDDVQLHAETTTSIVSPLETSSMDAQTTAQDIASFQVVLAADGKIVGFQPTSRVAVNHWASNPLSKVLYEGRKLSPGLLEPSLRIPCPREIVLLELLMSVNPQSPFALARPIQRSD